MIKLKKESGSITLFVLISVLFFVILLVGIFMTSSNNQRSSESMGQKNLDIYEKDVNDVDNIYFGLLDDSRKSGYIKDGLIVHYDGINNTGTGHDDLLNIWKDISGNGNDGELKLFSTSENSGWKDDGLRFDGNDDYVYLGNKISNIFKSSVTIELVINFDTTGVRDIILGNYNNSNNINIEKDSASRGRIFYKSGLIDFHSNNDLYLLGQKQNIGYTLNKTNKKFSFFTNSTEKSSVTNNIFSDNLDFIDAKLGRDERTGQTAFGGVIHSFRIYNRELSSQEIKHNYDVDKKRFDLK